MGKHSHSVDARVLRRIRAHLAEWIFTPADFADLGARTAVASALARYKAAGVIRQHARGVYGVPRQHPLLGALQPSLDAMVAALQRRDSARFGPAGAHAANLLQLTEQVPATVEYLTDGPSRSVKVGRMHIKLVHTTPRQMAAAGRLSGMLVQALRNLGPHHVTPARIAKLRKIVPQKERSKLLKDLGLAPAWMRPHFLEVARADDAPVAAHAGDIPAVKRAGKTAGKTASKTSGKTTDKAAGKTSGRAARRKQSHV